MKTTRMQEIIFKKVRSLGGKGKKKKSDQAIDKKKMRKKCRQSDSNRWMFCHFTFINVHHRWSQQAHVRK